MLTPLFISELLVSNVSYSFQTPCHVIAIGTGDHACSARDCIVQCTANICFVYQWICCPVTVYSIHVASTETIAFTIIISGPAIFSAGLRPFYTRHSHLSSCAISPYSIPVKTCMSHKQSMDMLMTAWNVSRAQSYARTFRSRMYHENSKYVVNLFSKWFLRKQVMRLLPAANSKQTDYRTLAIIDKRYHIQ